MSVEGALAHSWYPIILVEDDSGTEEVAMGEDNEEEGDQVGNQEDKVITLLIAVSIRIMCRLTGVPTWTNTRGRRGIGSRSFSIHNVPFCEHRLDNTSF